MQTSSSSEQLVASTDVIPLPLNNEDEADPLNGPSQLASPSAVDADDSTIAEDHVVDVTGVVAAAAAAAVPPSSSSPQNLDLKVVLQISSKIKDKCSRDRALLMALRNSRRELEEAESANNHANDRLASAKEVYTVCARLLAGYTPLEDRAGGGKKKGQVAIGTTEANVSIKLEPAGASCCAAMDEIDAVTQMQNAAIFEAEAATAAMTPRIKGQVQPEGQNVILPTNDIYLPEYFTAGGTMDENIASQFRQSFYLHITKGQSGASTIDNWKPPPNNANLKSRTQLEEWIHIATHWNTGADGLDAGAFRAKHKTWYSRMKPVSYNLGRRTGIHLREVGGMMVLCRYNKAGNKSTVYLDVGRLFDALFQIHALELNHRGRDATKNLADERYANIPDATVRAFLDTCPVCSARRGHGPLVDNAEQAHLQHSMGLGV
mmetsp:Transcript_5427/g.12354  ORF Transcript_5427/g.12354 Transcript_5427/m.12354 type:complete len:434 (+) Transcript_5427:52-1353(+)|eukprot:CAMPEP_0172317376 /NCGR_PEP_ID=MMETSP1058-20130122/31390_1 /TAXON_ID=83371 /ORGANISM="Detonula confervacea, Strain CCMP 353" /LENGTH=433 /DNA_ID=CAMNT_0013031917 /DNA_START=31 /DNA_END=1332 /DNA_ORIENTATION=-